MGELCATDRVTAPRAPHTLIPEPVHTWPHTAERDLTAVIKLSIPGWEDDPGLPTWALNVIMRAQVK